MTISTRIAAFADLPVLQQLISASVRGLSKGYYTERQIQSSLVYIFGVDTRLLEDGTYYVAEAGGEIVACGGWSKRNTLFGGDQYKEDADPFLDPARDAARIRAFFVHPDWARKGIGRMMIDLCETAARENGFTRLELAATLPGQPLYAALGYSGSTVSHVPMQDGEYLPIIRMYKEL
jgi:GNAT superfamily N-acetyltransferase